MQSATPKQYLPLCGKPVLQHSIEAFLGNARIAHVFVVISPNDHWMEQIYPSLLPERLSILRCGGDTRAESVVNGLQTIAGQVQAQDWVLVHDAARPGLDTRLISRLIEELGQDAVGGLLALPVVDTVKREDEANLTTVARDNLWLAQTPQMFRHQTLLGALQRALTQRQIVTDEASAIEMMGLRPKLVPGHPANLKVTLPQDMEIAQMYLQARCVPPIS